MTNATKLIGSHLAIIGNSGSGKSYTIRRLLEDSWGQSIQVVFDVEDEFHTLRGLRPYVLVNGSYADIDVPISGAAALARQVVRSEISVIIQINDMTILQRQEFIAAFLDALMAMKREDWRRMLIVIDEADKYIPQAGACPSSQPIINLMAQGRKRGFVGVLATQRAAKINKNAVSECANWMIGRVGSTNDRRVASDQLGFKLNCPEMEDLRSLGVGMFWRAGPAFGGRVLERVPMTASRHLQLGDIFVPPDIDAWQFEALRPPAAPVSIGGTRGPDHTNLAIFTCMAGAAAGIVTAGFFWFQHLLSGLI